MGVMGVFTVVEGEEHNERAVWPDRYSEDGTSELPHCREAINEMDEVMSPGCRTIARRRRDGMDLRARRPRELPKRSARGGGRQRRIFDERFGLNVGRIHWGRLGDTR
jgi:hypothetical protein